MTPEERRQRYRDYVEDWERYVHSSEDRARPYEKFSFGYGQLAMRSLFLLLGGAVVSVAPILSATPIEAHASIVFLACAFVAGLAFAALATLFIYINWQTIAYVIRCDAIVSDFQLRAAYGLIEGEGNVHPASVEASESAAKSRKWVGRTNLLGIGFGVAGYICLISGAMGIANVAANSFSAEAARHSVPRATAANHTYQKRKMDVSH